MGGKQEWAHKLIADKTVQKFAQQTLGHVLKRDSGSLLASVFWELVREAREMKHEREREEARLAHEEHLNPLDAIDDERADLQAELDRANREIERLKENLQNELKTKDALAYEIDAVHSEMRRKK